MAEVIVVYAELETRNFTFQAIGSSFQEVCDILENVFEAHIKKMGGWLTWEEVRQDIHVRVCKGGTGWVS
jgi:hypothetical protein